MFLPRWGRSQLSFTYLSEGSTEGRCLKRVLHVQVYIRKWNSHWSAGSADIPINHYITQWIDSRVARPCIPASVIGAESSYGRVGEECYRSSSSSSSESAKAALALSSASLYTSSGTISWQPFVPKRTYRRTDEWTVGMTRGRYFDRTTRPPCGKVHGSSST